MDQLIKNILINYTEECISDIIKNCELLSIPKCEYKSKIHTYLRNKYNIKGSPPKGQLNYWILRGFDREIAIIESKKYSHVYSTMSIKSVMARHNVDEEVAKKIIAERVAKGKITFSLKTDEEIIAINKSKASNNLENCIRLYGEAAGTRIFKERIDRLSLNVSLEGFIQRHGIEIGTILYDEFVKGIKKQNTLEGFIERYGEESGKIEYAKTSKLKSKSQTLSGYIERYGKIEGPLRFEKRQQKYVESCFNKSEEEILSIRKSKGKSFKELCDKHGKLRAIEIIQSRINNYKFAKASKQSLRIFIPFYKFLRKRGVSRNDIFLGVNGSSEFYIKEKDRAFVLFDFTVKSKRIIIEFHGIMFHPKNQHDPNWKCLYSNESADEKYKKDALKKEIAGRAGFTVITIWSDVDHKINLEFIKKEYEKNTNNI